jgi:hypothetical protein
VIFFLISRLVPFSSVGSRLTIVPYIVCISTLKDNRTLQMVCLDVCNPQHACQSNSLTAKNTSFSTRMPTVAVVTLQSTASTAEQQEEVILATLQLCTGLTRIRQQPYLQPILLSAGESQAGQSITDAARYSRAGEGAQVPCAAMTGRKQLRRAGQTDIRRACRCLPACLPPTSAAAALAHGRAAQCLPPMACTAGS